jgi:hypothetical protein
MIASTINLTIFIIMIIIYLNEMRNISMFLLNFNYIKDLSKVIMEQKCNNIYCEAETDRYNIAKNSYNLLLPNDIFNSKTYIIYTFLISILLFVYYYYILFDNILDPLNKKNNIIHLLILTIILVIIILRYIPNDGTGYINFFKDIDKSSYFRSFIVMSFLILAIAIYMLIKDRNDNNSYIILLCFMLSLILLLNLMTIVLSFKNNTKPILKTKELLFSLNNSLKYEIAEYDSKLKESPPNSFDLVAIRLDINDLSTKIDDGTYKKITKENIDYVLNILNIFSELSKIKFKQNFNDSNKIYIDKLRAKFADNLSEFIKTSTSDSSNYKKSDISELSLMFDEKVKLPVNYDGEEHMTNENSYNDEYVYTADISYDNPNLFYEKYWDISEKNINGMYGLPQFLWDYAYFTPKILFGGYNPNLFKILILVIIFIIIVTIIFWRILPIDGGIYNIYYILQPLIIFIILIIYILTFVCFNTWFNKYVVYKCLDCSYKRSLNKLNNIVTPYIRLYDNKIIKGNKNYMQHYIISNVFYSILCGYINLNNDKKDDKSIIIYADDALKASGELVKAIDKIVSGLKVDIVNISDDLKIKILKDIADAIIAVDDAITKTDKAYTSFSNASIVCASVKPELTKLNDKFTKFNVANKDKIILDASSSFAKNAKSKATNALELSRNSNSIAKANLSASKPINEEKGENTKYYDINKIKSNRLNFTSMNNSILNNDNEFREYYKARFSNIYDETYSNDNAIVLYSIFSHIFTSKQDNIKNIEEIASYFDNDIITKDKVTTIFSIIKKCFNLFEENKFNNNLVYYNNRDNKHKEINIDIYKKFKFYKYNDKIIPYKFILKLTTYAEVEAFIKNSDSENKNITDTINIIFPDILTVNNDADLLTLTQQSDMEKKRDNNLIKIIGKYLLILGHINANRIEYYDKKINETRRKIIYERKTYHLYKLISNTLYKDTYDDINDTFKTSTTDLVIEDEKYSKYKNLTYIYNYLETKYVNISSNNNNYLENIINSINNKINDDNKKFNDETKSAQYIFRDNIDKIRYPDAYDNEEEILNIANNISTFDFGSSYIFNMLILILYYYLIVKK